MSHLVRDVPTDDAGKRAYQQFRLVCTVMYPLVGCDLLWCGVVWCAVLWCA